LLQLLLHVAAADAVAVVVAAVGGCCTIWVLLVAVGWLTASPDAAAGVLAAAVPPST